MDTFINCKMIATIILVNISITLHNYRFLSVLTVFTIYSLSNFQMFGTVLLATITMLYIRPPNLLSTAAGL